MDRDFLYVPPGQTCNPGSIKLSWLLYTCLINCLQFVVVAGGLSTITKTRFCPTQPTYTALKDNFLKGCPFIFFTDRKFISARNPYVLLSFQAVLQWSCQASENVVAPLMMDATPKHSALAGEPHREEVIPVVEETLNVERRVVDTGVVVQISKVVSESVVPVSQSLVSEFVGTERVKVGRVIDEAPAVRYEGDVMIVPVVEERLVVRKELFLAEELRVTRRRETRQAESEVTLRRESVSVRRLDPLTQQWLEESADVADGKPMGPGGPS